MFNIIINVQLPFSKIRYTDDQKVHEKCLPPLIIREIAIETTLSITSHLLKWLLSKCSKVSVDEDAVHCC